MLKSCIHFSLIILKFMKSAMRNEITFLFTAHTDDLQLFSSFRSACRVSDLKACSNRALLKLADLFPQEGVHSFSFPSRPLSSSPFFEALLIVLLPPGPFSLLSFHLGPSFRYLFLLCPPNCPPPTRTLLIVLLPSGPSFLFLLFSILLSVPSL